MKKAELIKRIDSIENQYRVVITVVKLPSGALETIVNYLNLREKLEYLLNAYDDELRLKTNPKIELVDYIIL